MSLPVRNPFRRIYMCMYFKSDAYVYHTTSGPTHTVLPLMTATYPSPLRETMNVFAPEMTTEALCMQQNTLHWEKQRLELNTPQVRD